MIPLDADIIETAVPWWMVISCRNRWRLRDFVETGTNTGLTSSTAAQHFRRVHTIEIDPARYNSPIQALVEAKNVARYLGSSVDVIPSILSQLDVPTFWYLDAHWCGSGPICGHECPLLDELSAMAARDMSGDVVMIDNYGIFESCPPPLNPAQWPEVYRIRTHLHQCFPTLHISEFLDVLLATPSLAWQTWIL